jgi:hypothetical protein
MKRLIQHSINLFFKPGGHHNLVIATSAAKTAKRSVRKQSLSCHCDERSEEAISKSTYRGMIPKGIILRHVHPGDCFVTSARFLAMTNCLSLRRAQRGSNLKINLPWNDSKRNNSPPCSPRRLLRHLCEVPRNDKRILFGSGDPARR